MENKTKLKQIWTKKFLEKKDFVKIQALLGHTTMCFVAKEIFKNISRCVVR